MKLSKYLGVFSFVLAAIVLTVSSCTNDDVFEGPAGEVDFTTFGVNYENKGAILLVSDIVNGFYDLTDLDNASIGFTVGTQGEDVSSADVMVTYNGQSAQLATVSSFPATLTYPLSSVISALNLDPSTIQVGEIFSFGFQNVSTAGGAFSSGTTADIPVSCSSNLAGTYDYVSTNLQADNGYGCPSGDVSGTVTFEDQGGGKYVVSDLGFGQYGSSCWGDSPATSTDAIITDICNNISSGGLDQYGLVYIWVIKDVSGPNLSMSWSNDYGDRGDVVVTRPDGSNWPALFTN